MPNPAALRPYNQAMTHTKISALDATGVVQLRNWDVPVPQSEWKSLEFMDWKSGGDTNFAPLASALGDIECAGFWDHGKADKDGIWTSNAAAAPTLVGWTEKVKARFGRVRVIALEPQNYEAALRCMHQDDNNRLNPDGEGWVVRAWLELTDNPNSYMIMREEKDDPTTEQRVYLSAGTQYVVDTERLFHAVCHPGTETRYALIASFESGPELEEWIESERA